MTKLSVAFDPALADKVAHAQQNKQGIAVLDFEGEPVQKPTPAPVAAQPISTSIKRPSTSVPSVASDVSSPELTSLTELSAQVDASVKEALGWQETLLKKKADAINGVSIATGLSYGTLDEATASVLKAKAAVAKIDEQLSAVDAILQERAAKAADARGQVEAITKQLRVNQLVAAITAYNNRCHEFTQFVHAVLLENWNQTPKTYRSKTLVPSGATLADFEGQLADLFEIYEQLVSAATNTGVKANINPPAIPNIGQWTHWCLLDGVISLDR